MLENKERMEYTKDNKMEIFFTKLDPHRFLINTKKLYEKEAKRNEAIQQ